MTSLTLTQATIWKRLGGLWTTMVPSPTFAKPHNDPQEDSRAERDLILEMLDRNPDAFQSELDIHSMASLYRCKF